MKRLIPRDLALEALRLLDQGRGSPERFLQQAFERHEKTLDARDRAFTLHLVQGVLRWRSRLDAVLRKHVSFPFERVEPPVRDILRLALYQILYMDRVPPAAAVNEAVRQAKRLGRPHVARFVNAILRAVCRDGKADPLLPDRGQDPIGHLAIRHAYPEWMVARWVREYGKSSAEALLDAQNRIPAPVLRTNTLKTTRETLLRRLLAAGVAARPGRYAPESIVLDPGAGAVEAIPGYREGWWQVQGEASQVCARLLAPRPGECVADSCSGLGGKATHLAQLMEDRGLVLALDADSGRLRRQVQNARRLGVGCIFPVAADAAEPLPVRGERLFDRVLVDAPCSGLGTLSRHPEIKWLREERQLRRLASQQIRILVRAAEALKPGGMLLYATCTLSREENEGVVESFLGKVSFMSRLDLKERADRHAAGLIDAAGYLRCWPHRDHTEGFFGALFCRQPLHP